MGQLHKSFTDEQIKVLLQRYCQGKQIPPAKEGLFSRVVEPKLERLKKNQT